MLGTSSFGTTARGFPVYDEYWERGGRAFDTAWIYGFAFGPGCCERVLGEWLGRRAVSNEAFVLVKGAHTPECRPDRIEKQLTESLDRLGLGSCSLYMLHRDDPAVPVAEFVSVLESLRRAGCIQAYGFSNWSRPRFAEALDAARSQGLPTPTSVSNHASLMEMTSPIYEGTVDANDSEWWSWLRREDLVLMPWASQGRGSLAVTPDDWVSDEGLRNHWSSDANNQRWRRADQLATEREVSRTALGLAWVLRLPCRVRPIIGPRTVDELTDSLTGLEITLSSDEWRWLRDGAV
ncbi:MAG: hypothetical protein QOK43_2190 [Acidimicrobiaceae bacterium]|nr:hypothetical protein [Acidimicrobiaceae bacterium]